MLLPGCFRNNLYFHIYLGLCQHLKLFLYFDSHFSLLHLFATEPSYIVSSIRIGFFLIPESEYKYRSSLAYITSFSVTAEDLLPLAEAENALLETAHAQDSCDSTSATTCR